MQYRSHTTRSSRPGSARLLVAALLMLAVAGCQNNSERDLIARDRRMEEDQIYAMQDYVQQYQQLVCRYRSENASLKRQLAQGYVVEPEQSEPRPMPSTRNSRPSTKTGPQFETPKTPRGSEQRQPEEPKIEMPEVPPLKSTTWNDLNRETEQMSDAGKPDESNPQVLATSYDEPAHGEAASAAGEPAVDKTPAEIVPTSDVMLSGEVVANETGGGPRLMIDIAPFDNSGRVEAFDGDVSVMLLAPGSEGRQRSLGRWDFGRNYVRSAIDSAANEPTMRFHIELPAATPIGESTELWVRLVPHDGTKLLAHANVDLTRPGVFSSQTNKIWPSEESVIAASYEETAAPPAEAAATMNEGSWTTAEPGKPANLPGGFDSPAKGWRATSEPLPPVLANSAEVAPKHRFDKLREEVEASQKAAAEEPVERPGWAPERAGEAARRVATRPSWSATR